MRGLPYETATCWSNTHPDQAVCVMIYAIDTAKDPPDVLDRQKCLEALAALRHAKWFQVRIPSVLYLRLYSVKVLS